MLSGMSFFVFPLYNLTFGHSEKTWLTRYLVGENKKSLSLHHGKFNVGIFGKLHAAFEYTIPFYSSKSRK